MEYIFPRLSLVVYIGIGTIIIGLFVLLGLIGGKKSPLNYILGSIVCIILGIWVITISDGGTLTILSGKTTIKIPLFKQRVFYAEQIVIAKAVNLNSSSPYLPVRKKSGANVGKFKSGWFMLKNGEKAFLLINSKTCLYIKTKNGDVYLIGMKNFERLVKTFEQEMTTVTPL